VDPRPLRQCRFRRCRPLDHERPWCDPTRPGMVVALGGFCRRSRFTDRPRGAGTLSAFVWSESRPSARRRSRSSSNGPFAAGIAQSRFWPVARMTSNVSTGASMLRVTEATAEALGSNPRPSKRETPTSLEAHCSVSPRRRARRPRESLDTPCLTLPRDARFAGRCHHGSLFPA